LSHNFFMSQHWSIRFRLGETLSDKCRLFLIEFDF